MSNSILNAIESRLVWLSTHTPIFDIYDEISGIGGFGTFHLQNLNFLYSHNLFMSLPKSYSTVNTSLDARYQQIFQELEDDVDALAEVLFYFDHMCSISHFSRGGAVLGDVAGVVVESFVNTIEAFDCYTALELSPELCLQESLLSIDISNILNLETPLLFDELFLFVPAPRTYMITNFSELLLDEEFPDVAAGGLVADWGQLLFQSEGGIFKLLSLRSPYDTFRNWGHTCRITDNVKFFAWADEARYLTGGESIDWYDACTFDDGLADFLRLLTEDSEHSRGWLIDTTSLRDLEAQYLSQAGSNRLFVPRPFVASPMYNALGTPWFLDYVHLSSWFFFMALFVLVMWVNLVWSIFAKHIEARQPMRETRGFSRAQTGDGITAVLPMTWSITMLLHASTHSVNFDENTTGTVFTLTVIAYQWGWNYYFPRDIVDIYWAAPRQVGYGAITGSGDFTYYDKLLNYTRQNMVGRFTNEFKNASRTGRNVAPNALSLFVRPQLVASDFASTLPRFFGDLTAKYAADGLTSSTYRNYLGGCDAVTARLVELLEESGASSSIGFPLGAPRTPAVENFKNILINFNKINTPAGYGLTQLQNIGAAESITFNWALSSRYMYRESMLRYHSGDALRPKSTAVLSANRLLLIHNIFSEWLYCTKNFKSAIFESTNQHMLQTASIVRNLQLREASANTPASDLNPINDADFFGDFFLTNTNIAFNVWLLFFNLERYLLDVPQWSADRNYYNLFSTWGLLAAAQLVNSRFDFLAQLLIDHDATTTNSTTTPLDVKPLYSTISIDFSAAADGLLRKVGHPLDFNIGHYALSPLVLSGTINTQYAEQLFTYTSDDTAFPHFYNALLVPEDVGLNFSPALKEFSYRISCYTSFMQFRLTQAQDGQNLKNFASSLSLLQSENISLFVFFDVAQRRLADIAGYRNHGVLKQLIGDAASQNLRQNPFDHNTAGEITEDVSAMNHFLINPLAFANISGIAHQTSLLIAPISQTYIHTLPIFQTKLLNPIYMLQQTSQQFFSSVAAYISSQHLQKCNTTYFAGGYNLLLPEKLLLDCLRLPEISLASNHLCQVSHGRRPLLLRTCGDAAVDFAVFFNAVSSLRQFFELSMLPRVASSHYCGSGNFFPLSNQTSVTPPHGAADQDSWYNGVDDVRPIRLATNKIANATFFAFKLGDLPAGRAQFSSKILFDWSLSWSAQTQIYRLPLYKFYRANFIKKVNLSFWAAQPLSESQQSLWSATGNWWNRPLKNNTIVPIFYPQLPQRDTSSSFVFNTPAVLDGELMPFMKNRIVLLPSPHEEFDINFTYQYWAPETNTTRRADHSTRFRTTWNAFFTSGVLSNLGQLPNSELTAGNNPLTDSAASLFNTKFYMGNAGTSEFSGNYPVGAVSTRLSCIRQLQMSPIPEQQLRAWYPINYLSILSYSNSPAVLHAYAQLRNPLQSAQPYPTNWCALWQYRDTQPNYKLSDTHPHASAAPVGYADAQLHSLLTSNINTYLLAQRAAASGANSINPLHRTTRIAADLPSISSDHATDPLIIFASKLVKQRSAFEFVRYDVGSMKRLRVTKGICLPVDYPIHIICGSKDVIHSWAIPGLGIKIDCIPGYNSHRRVMFRWRGIYWGQCMEVCGRYHHWMPILVRIVHRDVFLSWCLIYLRTLSNRSTATQQAQIAEYATGDWLALGAQGQNFEEFLDSLSQILRRNDDFSAAAGHALLHTFRKS